MRLTRHLFKVQQRPKRLLYLILFTINRNLQFRVHSSILNYFITKTHYTPHSPPFQGGAGVVIFLHGVPYAIGNNPPVPSSVILNDALSSSLASKLRSVIMALPV